MISCNKNASLLNLKTFTCLFWSNYSYYLSTVIYEFHSNNFKGSILSEILSEKDLSNVGCSVQYKEGGQYFSSVQSRNWLKSMQSSQTSTTNSLSSYLRPYFYSFFISPSLSLNFHPHSSLLFSSLSLSLFFSFSTPTNTRVCPNNDMI